MSSIPAIHDPLTLLVTGAIVAVGFLVLHAVVTTFRDAGFRLTEVLLVLFAPLVLGNVNVAFHAQGNLVLAANLVGFLVPTFVAVKIVYQERVPPWRTAIAVVVTAAIAYRVSEYVPGEGVLLPLFPVVAGTALVALALVPRSPQVAPLLAYVAGVLGVLLGADLLRIPDILAAGADEFTLLSIGGAGALDAVFLVGVLAVGLQMLVYGALGMTGGARAR